MRTPCLLLIILLFGPFPGYGQQLRVELKPAMLTNEAEVGDPSGLVDEQRRDHRAAGGQAADHLGAELEVLEANSRSAPIWTWVRRRTCRASGCTTPTTRATW